MPVLLHEESSKVPLAVVASATQVPSTQASVAYEGVENYDIIYPNEAITSNTTPGTFVTWQAPMVSSMTDISESFIFIRGYFDIAANQTVNDQTNQYAGVSDMLSLAMFQDVTIELNGVQVVQSQGVAHPICALADVIKNEPYTVSLTDKITRGFFLTERYDGDEPILERQYYVDGTRNPADPGPSPTERQITLVYRMSDLGLRTRSSWLPPDVAIRIRVKTSPSELLRRDLEGTGTDTTAAALEWKFTQADLYLARRKLKAQAAVDLDAAWKLSSCKVPYERVQSNVTFIDANALSINITNALAGPTPKSVMVFMLKQDALLGNNANGLNPIFGALKPVDDTHWQNARLSLGGGRFYPIQPFTADSSTNFPGNDWALMYQMYRATANASPFLKDSNFDSIKPLCFQIAATKSAYDEVEETSIQFQAQLSGAQNSGMAVVMVSFTDHIIEISKEGQVMVTTD